MSQTLCCIGLYLGIKWFIIDYIYYRFPRIRAKHDSVYQIWQTLPTDSQLEKQRHKLAIDRVSAYTLETKADIKKSAVLCNDSSQVLLKIDGGHWQ